MKRHLTYIMFGTILILGHFVFAGRGMDHIGGFAVNRRIIGAV